MHLDVCRFLAACLVRVVGTDRHNDFPADTIDVAFAGAPGLARSRGENIATASPGWAGGDVCPLCFPAAGPRNRRNATWISPYAEHYSGSGFVDWIGRGFGMPPSEGEFYKKKYAAGIPTPNI